MPSSSMSILAPVSSWSRRIVLPPGPMTRPIFSGLIWIWISRGALAEISSRGRLIARSIARRISSRASRACSSVSRMISSVMPSFLRSSWMPVMPRWVPATLKSMSPKWSSSPMMSVSRMWRPAASSCTRPIEMPPTGSLIGTPASIRLSVRAADRGHRAGAVGLEDVGDDADRVGELATGRAGSARPMRSARAPWPISRRPGPRIGRTSPTANDGML